MVTGFWGTSFCSARRLVAFSELVEGRRETSVLREQRAQCQTDLGTVERGGESLFIRWLALQWSQVTKLSLRGGERSEPC